jgi:hypothetical protein
MKLERVRIVGIFIYSTKQITKNMVKNVEF